MLNNKFIVLFALGASLQNYAMHLEVTSENKLVHAVVLQVAPGYIQAAKFYNPATIVEQQAHEAKIVEVLAKLNKVNHENIEVPGNRILNVSYFKCEAALGLYYFNFAKPTSFSLVNALVKEVPGVEALHDTQAFEDPKQGYKERLLEKRYSLLDAEAEQRKKAYAVDQKANAMESTRPENLRKYTLLALGKKASELKASGESTGELISAK